MVSKNVLASEKGEVSSKVMNLLMRQTGIGIIFLKWNSTRGYFIDSNFPMSSRFVAKSENEWDLALTSFTAFSTNWMGRAKWSNPKTTTKLWEGQVQEPPKTLLWWKTWRCTSMDRELERLFLPFLKFQKKLGQKGSRVWLHREGVVVKNLKTLISHFWRSNLSNTMMKVKSFLDVE